MKIVIDTNILFSASLSKNSRFKEILFDDKYKFIAPNILLDEIYEHFDKILKYSKQSESDTIEYINLLIRRIEFIDFESIPQNIYKKAYDLCKDYDDEDTPFIATAIYFDALIWTGDKIKLHLIKNGFNSIFEIIN